MTVLNHDQIAALVVKAQQGNEDAFALLYAATSEKQLRFATAFLKDPMLAEDAVQEVYLSMYQALPHLENPKLFVAYLNRICYNTCVDYKEKQSKNPLDLDGESLLELSDKAPFASPSEQYEFTADSDALYTAIGTLPPQQRAAFLFRYYNDLKIKDIAKTMNVSESTVKRAIKSATKTLSETLSKGENSSAVESGSKKKHTVTSER